MKTFSICLHGLVLTTALSVAAPAVAQKIGQGTDGSYQVAQQSYTDVLVSLERAGYRVLKMQTTFLGRLKILAQNRSHVREVVVSRSTGEIMSDRVVRVLATAGDKKKSQTVSGQEAQTNQGGPITSLRGTVDGVTSSTDVKGGSANTGGATGSVGGGGISIGN